MDERSFEQLYREHAAAVRRYVRRRLAADEVDDALADIWLTAWRRRSDVRPAIADGALGEALARLPERDREALLLTAWEGLSVLDAAMAMHCSPAAFKSRLHRARARLADELGAIEAPPEHAPLTTVEAKP